MTAFISNGSALYISGDGTTFKLWAEIQDFPSLPNTKSTVDATRIGDTRTRSIAGIIEDSDFTFTAFFDPADEGYVAAVAAFESGAETTFRFDFAGTGKSSVFTAVVVGLPLAAISNNSPQTHEITLSIRSVSDLSDTPTNPTGSSGGVRGGSRE